MFSNTSSLIPAFNFQLLIIFLLTSILAIYVHYQKSFTYWTKKGVPISNPRFPAGDVTLPALGWESLYVRLQQLYNEFKSKGHKHGGIYFFNGPVYFPLDPSLIKAIMTTDFNYFTNRGMYLNEEGYPLTAHILSMEGEQWKTNRAKLTPTFTSGKMKSMFSIIKQQTDNLMKTVDSQVDKVIDVNIKDILTRFTIDVIGSTAFGIECNSLKHPDTEFVQMVNKIFHQSGWKLLRLIVEEGLQNPGNMLKISHSDKEIERFFTELVRDTIEYRDKNHVVRDDFLNILMQLRDTSGISFREIVAQSFLFFTAGFETSSSTMSFCIHELTYNQQIQDDLRREIREKLGTKWANYSYENVMKLPYLDRVIKETLRKYPPLSWLTRVCVENYVIPETNITIEKNTPVIISLLGLHRDPDHFPEPLKFDPDRFIESNNQIVPFTYLPFGDGPRNCIGLRFGLMQVKLAMAALLATYKFMPSDKTAREIDFDTSTTAIVLTVKRGIHVKIIKV